MPRAPSGSRLYVSPLSQLVWAASVERPVEAAHTRSACVVSRSRVKSANCTQKRQLHAVPSPECSSLGWPVRPHAGTGLCTWSDPALRTRRRKALPPHVDWPHERRIAGAKQAASRWVTAWVYVQVAPPPEIERGGRGGVDSERALSTPNPFPCARVFRATRDSGRTRLWANATPLLLPNRGQTRF